MDKTKTEVEIPHSAFTWCPLTKRLRQVIGCIGCEHFAGLADRFPGMVTATFSARYQVLCRADPVKREVFEVEMPEQSAGGEVMQ